MEYLGFLVDPEILYHAGPKISILYSLDMFCHAFLSKPLSGEGTPPKSFFYLQECLMKALIFCL